MEEPEIYCERRGRGEGGWERENETWTQPDVESGSALPLCLRAVVYNEEVPGGASRIQTRSDRKTRPSQRPPLPSPHTSLLCALPPSLSRLLLGHLRAAPSPQASEGSWVRGPSAAAVEMSADLKQRRCNQSEWNPKTQQEHERDRLSPHHVKTENTGRCCFVFLWLFRFRQLTLPPPESAGAGGCPRRRGQEAEGRAVCVSVRLQHRDRPASPQLNSNSCLLPRAMGWLYAVFPKLHYQKFNNSKSTLLLLMCVSVTNGPDERNIKRNNHLCQANVFHHA